MNTNNTNNTVARRRAHTTAPQGYPRKWVELVEGAKGDLVAYVPAIRGRHHLVVFQPRGLPPAAAAGDCVQIEAVPAKSGRCLVGRALATSGYGWHLVKAKDVPPGHAPYASIEDHAAALMLRRLERAAAAKAAIETAKVEVEVEVVEKTPTEAFVDQLKAFSLVDQDEAEIVELQRLWLDLDDDDQLSILEDGQLDTRMHVVFGC